MTESGRRRTRLEKAWGNLIVRTAVYYALVLGAAAGLWRWFPTQARRLTGDLLGDRPVTEGGGAFEDLIAQPLFGASWSTDMAAATVAMVVAGLFALPVAWIYILTRQKKGFRQSLVHSLIMLAVVVAGVVVLVKNSLALAFSLAGIVAAVRFRNTLEDSKDAVYIFVATGIGLAAGVDLPVAIALSIIFNVVALALWYSDLGRSSAAFEGSVAERRLQQARAHVNRPSGFVQRLDDELLKAMSPDQLDALAERAWRRRRRNAPSGEVERAGFESLLCVRTGDVDAAMRAVESVLDEYVKRWTFGTVVHEDDGTHVIEYAVQLKKSTAPAAFVEAVQARGMGVMMGVELS
ncbi:MAG TPA: DUF4956 domain-containing protein [Gemmatimonadales bacterium]